MNGNSTFVLAAAIGFVAGMRSMTAPAAVSWGAHLGRVGLRGSALAFMGSAAAVGTLTLLALAEFVVDLMPQAPNRTDPGSLVVRAVTGGLAGACLCLSGGRSAVAGAVLGAVGAMAGAFAGFEARTRLVKVLSGKGTAIAVAEDLVAIALAWVIVFWA